MPSSKEQPVTNEQMFTDAFGDGYWDLPEYERFEMVVKKMLGQDVPRVTREEAKARADQYRED